MTCLVHSLILTKSRHKDPTDSTESGTFYSTVSLTAYKTNPSDKLDFEPQKRHGTDWPPAAASAATSKRIANPALQYIFDRPGLKG